MTLYKKRGVGWCGVVHINEKGIKDVGVGGDGDGTIKKTVRYEK